MAVVKTKAELETELKEKDEALSALQQQMKQMQEMMAQLAANQQAQPIIQTVQEKDITTRKIKVISLCGNSLNLNTKAGGTGKAYPMPHYGYERFIRYDDLEDIVNACYNFVELFYICDKEAVEELGLADKYAGMIDKKGMDSITNLDGVESVEMFKQLPKMLQEQARDMIIEKLAKGQSYDENKIYQINEYLGINLRDKAKTLKSILPEK